MAVAELDIPQLASFCSVPQASINSLLHAPTAELVQTLLTNISVKFHEHNELSSEKLRLVVELEAAVRGQETRGRALKASLDKSHKETAELRQKLQAEETARTSVETEFENLKTATSSSTSEIATLRTRIGSLESSNRDTLSLLDSKSTAYDNLVEELNGQHQKIVDLRKAVSDLEQSLQSANAASSSAKYREQSHGQEIEQLKRNNDWLDKELKTKSAEHSKYRKEKGHRLSELQRQYEEASSTIDSLNRTETTLRRRVEEVNQKLDESFQKIQRMQEEASQKEEAFTVELDAANRLTKLRENSALTERERAQDLSAQLESAKEDASEQIGRLSAELETEHIEREANESKIAELEVQVEHLQTDLEQARRPATPHTGVNGFAPHTPTRGNSTTQVFSPASSRAKGNMSITKMYSNYNEVKTELDTEKRKNEKLVYTIDELVHDMEVAQPEIEELRAEHSRLESEVTDLSAMVDVIGKERDQALKGAKKHEGQIEAKVKEGEVLRQQLRDLSSQIKILLMEAHLRDNGQDNLSVEGRAQLESLAHGEEDETSEGVTDTDRYISTNLVTFRNIAELEEQNSKLLKITREIGERMEHEEALRKQTEETRNWDELQQKYERCRDEIKSLVTQSQSYIRERDMFRRMLAHRGQIPVDADVASLFGASTNGDGAVLSTAQADILKSVEDSPSAKDMSDYAKLLKEMQAHFDAYRQEAATDQSTLKEQVNNLSKTNSELRSEVVRSSSQVTLAHERYEMLQANYAMLKNENSELQKRSQTFSDTAAKHDLRVQQVAEDLVEAKGLIDSMRNELANLKAEKEFWKTVERRITEDNESLLNERGRLNTLNANLQNLINEREHADNEARRRLQTQIETLEKDLQVNKARLSEEVEEHKRSIQRREYEHEQNQKRIDDLVSSVGTLREQLASTTTTRDHLSGRVDELTIELRSAQERLDVLQAASTARADQGGAWKDNAGAGEDSSLTREQELVVEVSELKRDLDLAKAELENVKGQVEQYKAISQSSEEELMSLNETQDLYRQETDKLIEEKDSKIKELEQRVEDTTSELGATDSELSELRNEQAEYGRKTEDLKKSYEAQIAQVKAEDDRHAAAAQYYQEDLKAQAEIARQAQQNYENELVKHADAAKALQKVRGELNDVKIEVVEARTEAESARTSLSQNEESLANSRERFEREISELRSARQELKVQNDHLHRQLETLTNVQRRATSGEEQSQEDSPAPGLENLQEVITYLRREKEIVDVQLELSAQEAKRLKQQLDYTQSQLDDTRLKLNQQRRIEADSERTALDHSKLMETINDLNTHREANVTLRAESRQAQAALAARTKEIEQVRAMVEPLQTEVQELKGEREAQEGEITILKENCDRWQQRAQNVLQKYDRVDPAELEALKEQIKTLEAERDDLNASTQDLQVQIDNAAGQITQAQEQGNERLETMKARLTEQFKGRSKTLSDRIKEKDSMLQAAVNERHSLEEKLSSLGDIQNQLGTARAERDASMEIATALKAQNRGEDGEVDESGATHSSEAELKAAQASLEAANAKANSEISKSSKLQEELDTSKSRIAELESQITQLQQSLESSNSHLAQLRASQQKPTDLASSSDMESQLQKLREELAQAQQDAESLRTTASVTATLANAPTEQGSKSVAEQVAEHAEAVRKELERRHDERIKQNDESYQKRIENMKATLNKRLNENKAHIRQLSADHDQALQSLRSEHQHEMEALQVRHKDEISELQRHEESKFAELKATLEKAHPTESANGDSKTTGEAQTPLAEWKPTEQEARAFVNTNETVKNIVRRNITQHTTKTKEDLTTRLKEEHGKDLAERLADAEGKAETAKKHAVMMEGKKTALQVNMANNKARVVQFKLDLVQKATEETPQKPVQEVWNIVKDAKPPAQGPGTQGPFTQGPVTQGPVTQGPVTQGPAVQSPTAQAPLAQGSIPQGPISQVPIPQGPILQPQQQAAKPGVAPVPVARQPATVAQGTETNPPLQPKTTIAPPNPFLSSAQGLPPGISTFGRPSPAALPPQPRPIQSPTTPNQRPPSNNANTAEQALHDSSTLPPRQPPPNRPNPNNHPSAGTGPSALRGLHSGLPVARGGSMRGNANPRGRGSGIARGGGPGIDTSRGGLGPQQGRGSPTSAGMNPGARQFVPGNKRPREEGGEGGIGKRIRGGGGGGGA